jgi:hypothetical protein
MLFVNQQLLFAKKFGELKSAGADRAEKTESEKCQLNVISLKSFNNLGWYQRFTVKNRQIMTVEIISTLKKNSLSHSLLDLTSNKWLHNLTTELRRLRTLSNGYTLVHFSFRHLKIEKFSKFTRTLSKSAT